MSNDAYERLAVVLRQRARLLDRAANELALLDQSQHEERHQVLSLLESVQDGVGYAVGILRINLKGGDL